MQKLMFNNSKNTFTGRNLFPLHFMNTTKLNSCENNLKLRS